MSLANLAHLHLLLNHFPTIGTIVGLGLFLVALFAKHEDLKRAGLVVFLVMAFLALPVYMTGKAAQQAVEGRPGVVETMIERHQDAALLAFVFMEITGAFAWLALWQFRRILRLARWNVFTVLVLSIVTVGLMARAANMGGEIRHPEIQGTTTTEGTVTPDAEWLKSASIAGFINTTNWAWPALETLHFIGLCLLLGVVLVVNLRMLGVMKNVSFAAVHRLLPWGILGFGINLMTGMFFFITVPEQYTQNIALHWKMVLVLLAGINALYLTVFDEPWALASGDDAPLTGKVIAASAIFLWLGVIYFGRMMPFIGGSF
jgi:Na+-transporting methylmalonyl-CoA/oxaloacetate decarboxylase gamma subunit